MKIRGFFFIMKTVNDIKLNYLSNGNNSLSDHELLSLCGINISYPHPILLLSMPLEELILISGIGQKTALKIIAISELIKRKAKYIPRDKVQITSSSTIADIMRPILGDLDHEEFWVIYLNTSNKIITKECHTSGGIQSTIVDVKLVIRKAILHLASSIILVHNHPSGNTTPGEQDKIVTKRLKDGIKLFDIKLLDHLIITAGRYYSFADEGIL